MSMNDRLTMGALLCRAESAEAAVRAVLDLHGMHDDCGEGCCRYCDECAQPWPCATRDAIAAALGEDTL